MAIITPFIPAQCIDIINKNKTVYTQSAYTPFYEGLATDLGKFIGQKNNSETRCQIENIISTYSNKYANIKINIDGTPLGDNIYPYQINNHYATSMAFNNHILFTNSASHSGELAITQHNEELTVTQLATTDYANIDYNILQTCGSTYGSTYESYDTINTNAKKFKIKSNMFIFVKSRASDIDKYVPKNEQIAVETLREMITETEFRKYVKYGFILVKGKSGNVYQVFKNKSHTKVWKNGQVIEEVCVRIKSNQNVPPTDNVIAFKTMIETDEQDFKNIGNVYKYANAA